MGVAHGGGQVGEAPALGAAGDGVDHRGLDVEHVEPATVTSYLRRMTPPGLTAQRRRAWAMATIGTSSIISNRKAR